MYDIIKRKKRYYIERKGKENMKTNKSLALLVLFCALIFCFNKSIYADTLTEQENQALMQEVIQDANNYVKNVYNIDNYYPQSVTINGQEHQASYQYYQKYQMIIYWSGNDLAVLNPSYKDKVIAKAGDPFNKKAGEIIYRVIGYDLNGNKLYNPYFPIDALDKKPAFTLIDPKSQNPLWLDIIKNKPDLRKHIMANLQKSIIEKLASYVELFFLYRKPSNYSQQELQDYQNNFTSLLLNLFANTDKQASKIKLITLPTDNVKGFVQYWNSYGFYGLLFLEFQDDLDANVEVRHFAVNFDQTDKTKFKISDGFHAINSIKNYFVLAQGETKSFQANQYYNYQCIGCMIYQDEAAFQKAVGREGNRKAISDYMTSDEVTYKHEYQPDNDQPIIVFFYKKTAELSLEEPTGNIVVSANDYEVTRAIPSDKNVKIEVNTDSNVLAEYAINYEENEAVLPIYILESRVEEDATGHENIVVYEDYVGYITIKYYYYKLYDYLIYNLKGAEVFNPKLRKNDAIFIPAKDVGTSKAKVYVHNLVDIDFPEKINGYKIEKDFDYEKARFKIFIRVYEDQGYINSAELNNIVDEIFYTFELKVRNDYLILGDQVILDDSIFDGYYPPEPGYFDKEAVSFTKDKQLIKAATLNGNGETTGNLVYQKIAALNKQAEAEKKYPILGNNVFIHTPSANRTVLQEDIKFDQRVSSKKQGVAVPLDHVMKLDILTDFQHINQKGYGLRDYQEHLKAKTIKFDFDAYVSLNKSDIELAYPVKKFYLKKGELFQVAPSVKAVYYKAALWAKEGKHKIETRAIAKNAPAEFTAQKNANLDFNNYAASDTKAVYLTPRIFDFCIEKVYDNAYLSNDNTKFYNVGTKNKEGFTRKRFKNQKAADIKNLIMPIKSGKSHLNMPINRDVKMGYPFVFSIKTIGNYYAEKDILSLKPRFYYIDNNGQIDQNIALYYNYNSKLVKLGSQQDSLKQSLVYRDLVNLDEYLELVKTTELLKNNAELANVLDYSKYVYKTSKPVFCYKPSLSVLSYPFRTFIGSVKNLPDGVSADQAIISVQKWKGIYGLPASTLAFKVDEAGKVDLKKPLKTGQIGVYFDIIASKNNNVDGADISYVTATSNQYINEGYLSEQDGVTYIPGTCLIYSLEETADEDLKTE